ncbi:RNA polymerase sigma-70 factor, ECF subfamily [Streptomyces sp. 1222.5]|uniref:RNA polymerase sigma factor n=1 Tax=unclassified Streptomyces TaxID=2593676 RepID=UPI000898C59D|nr:MULTISPECIES: RNA polymerase sigma factor [unclassified Streptomyces]PKW07857.1 RNA polymerase sigma-70 factor (ECF subfamily) [Streptomyces sp. 5112.2]SEC78094.1 RNA polymerase sigma-70 factor, ECF subfamily [Streptomyces sp. 1222.5]SED02138.1 RNA polymerase sigma-70 factor, ECF subfamily [Streptomyces sp. 2231.1]
MGGQREKDDGADAALLRAVAAGDAAAMATLYDRHAGWLHARLTRRCADPEVVREVVQDTFVTVWRSAAGHRGEDAGGWLWTIAARRLVDARRAQERVARFAGPPLEPGSAGRYEPAAAPSAEDRVLAGLEYGDVGAALDRISPELREVLRATVVDGLTTREAARLLGIPEGTVKSRARRARAELRAALDLLHPSPLGGTA